MSDQLLQMQDRLQEERQKLARRLKQIDDDLVSLVRVINLMHSQRTESTQSQLDLIKGKTSSNRFAKLTFRESVSQMLYENPGKFWVPKEIASELLRGGFKTRAKKFGPTVRTMLHGMRVDGSISATETETGWLYGSPIEKKERLRDSTGKKLVAARRN